MVHPLAVREFRSRGGVEIFVQGLSEFRAESWEDVLALLRVGSRNRVARSTRLNVHSSRSHAVLQLAVETDRLDGQSTRAKLSLIDLAGSEKMDVLSELRAMREQDGAGEEGEAADGGGAERGRSGSRSRSPWDRSFAGRAAASRGRGSDVSDASSGSDRDSLGPPEEARAPRRGRSVTRRRPPTDWRDTARRMRPGSQRPPQVPLDGSGGVTRGVAAGVRGIRALSRRSSSSHAGPRRAGGVPDEQLPTYPGASGGSALDGEAAAAARAAREQREKELRAINSSLSALGNVIAALTDASRKHIPYRDSTLTVRATGEGALKASVTDHFPRSLTRAHAHPYQPPARHSASCKTRWGERRACSWWRRWPPSGSSPRSRSPPCSSRTAPGTFSRTFAPTSAPWRPQRCWNRCGRR